jgi:hypothetical protein
MNGVGLNHSSRPSDKTEGPPMAAVVQAPLDLVEAVASLRLPARTDRHLQALMDRNTEGALSPAEREELEALVELSESISLLRARALHLLGRQPG